LRRSLPGENQTIFDTSAMSEGGKCAKAARVRGTVCFPGGARETSMTRDAIHALLMRQKHQL
jgi:hypothetical protein